MAYQWIKFSFEYIMLKDKYVRFKVLIDFGPFMYVLDMIFFTYIISRP